MRRKRTKQREVIVEELRRMDSHPTALELYEVVRRRMPRISLGTVYRNLDLLSADGTIRRLEPARGRARYDARETPHNHIHCVSCGRIDDVELPVAPRLEGVPAQLNGYEEVRCHIELAGRCPDCSGRSEFTCAEM